MARLKALNGVTDCGSKRNVEHGRHHQDGNRLSGANEVKFTYMAQTAMLAAMSAKSIEAYIASSPFADQAVTAGPCGCLDQRSER